MSYQLLTVDDNPTEIRDVDDEDLCKIDVLWGYLHGIKQPRTNILEYDLRLKVAEVILYRIPHAAEREFFPMSARMKVPPEALFSQMELYSQY